MEFIEIPIRTEHPPHSTYDQKVGRLKAPGWARIETIPGAVQCEKTSRPISGIFPKLVLFFFVFIISFHSPTFVPEVSQREQTIKEILGVLERQRTGLANVTQEELA